MDVKASESSFGDWSLPDSLPLYVQIIPEKEAFRQQQMPDSLFNAIAGSTIFRVNSTRLNTEDPFLKELVAKVIPYAHDNWLQLEGLEIRGAASPEGPYNNNVRLSVGRADALRQFLVQHLDPRRVNDAETKLIAEDYGFLLWSLEQMHDSAAPIVKSIIDECGIDNPAAIKQKLRLYDHGYLWRRLLHDIFPQLRAARVVLYFSVVPHKEPQPLELDFFTDADATGAAQLNPVFDLRDPGPFDMPYMFEMYRKHMLLVSTNLLYDAFYMPNYGMAPMLNVQLEFFPRHGRFSFLGGFTAPYWHHWNQHKFFEMRDYHLEARCYFRPGPLRNLGPYMAVYANATEFSVGLSATKGWKGEGIGAAVKLGYAVPLGNSRWRLDFHIAAGAYRARYDKYVYGNPITGEKDGFYYYDWVYGPETFKKRAYKKNWLGPTEAGITLTYDLLFWRRQKGGVSMLRKEAVWQ